MSDLTEYVSKLIEICRFQAELIDKLFMEILETKCTEEISQNLPFMMDKERQFRKEFD